MRRPIRITMASSDTGLRRTDTELSEIITGATSAGKIVIIVITAVITAAIINPPRSLRRLCQDTASMQLLQIQIA